MTKRTIIGNPTGSDEITLFGRDGDGGREISDTIGFISDRIDFDVWRPLLPLGIRDVSAIVGRDVVEVLARFYMNNCYPTDECPAATTIPLGFLRQAVAMFTWLKIIPTLDAQHDVNGRTRRLGENEKGLSALEQWKDESNILSLAYEATDALIEALDRGKFPFWLRAEKYLQRAGLLVRSKEEFDSYYLIGSHRLFLTLLPMIRETQQAYIAPVLGRAIMQRVLDGDPVATSLLYDNACRAIALLTMKKAVERLPVEVLPEGVVQFNRSAPVSQRLKAEKQAREAVAASLGADAQLYLRLLQDDVATLVNTDKAPDLCKPGPIVHTKGISF